MKKEILIAALWFAVAAIAVTLVGNVVCPEIGSMAASYYSVTEVPSGTDPSGDGKTEGFPGGRPLMIAQSEESSVEVPETEAEDRKPEPKQAAVEPSGQTAEATREKPEEATPGKKEAEEMPAVGPTVSAPAYSLQKPAEKLSETGIPAETPTIRPTETPRSGLPEETAKSESAVTETPPSETIAAPSDNEAKADVQPPKPVSEKAAEALKETEELTEKAIPSPEETTAGSAETESAQETPEARISEETEKVAASAGETAKAGMEENKAAVEKTAEVVEEGMKATASSAEEVVKEKAVEIKTAVEKTATTPSEPSEETAKAEAEVVAEKPVKASEEVEEAGTSAEKTVNMEADESKPAAVEETAKAVEKTTEEAKPSEEIAESGAEADPSEKALSIKPEEPPRTLAEPEPEKPDPAVAEKQPDPSKESGKKLLAKADMENMTQSMKRGDVLDLGDGRVAYKVKGGDTFSQICDKVFGTSKVWREQAEKLGIDIRKIRPGNVLYFEKE